MPKAMNIFDDDNFSTGGGVFPDGLAQFTNFRFTTFDFGTPGNDQVVLSAMGQPLGPDGSKVGEPQPVRWACTTKDGKKDVDLVNPVKGEKGTYSGIAISESNKHGKLFGLADFSVWRDHLKKVAALNPEIVDMDEVGTDITNLDDTIFEVSKYVKKEQATPKLSDKDAAEAAAGPKKEPWKVVIFTEAIDPKTLKGAKKGASKKKEEEEEEEEKTKSSKKGGKAKEVEIGDDVEEIVSAYLAEELTDDREGENPLGLRVGVSAWAVKKGKSADLGREAQEMLKTDFAPLLKANGWKLVDKKLAKDS